VAEPRIFDQSESSGDRVVSWARVVWIDRAVRHPSCAPVLNRWLFRPCDSAGAPWKHNFIYEIECRDCGRPWRVKVGDIRPCAAKRPREAS